MSTQSKRPDGWVHVLDDAWSHDRYNAIWSRPGRVYVWDPFIMDMVGDRIEVDTLEQATMRVFVIRCQRATRYARMLARWVPHEIWQAVNGQSPFEDEGGPQ